jgi:CheY-like chemotaxis protein
MLILVLEDEPIIAFGLEDMLLEFGCTEVKVAARLPEARRIMAEERVDLAILDVNIHGEQSYPLADELAARRIPYFFASGYGDKAHPDRHRAVLTVTKPYSSDDIEAALNAALASGALP